MCSFRSVLLISATTLTIGFFTLDFLKDYTRYDFLVKGDMCIAFDRKEEAIKIVDANGCIVVPMHRSAEEALRDRVGNDVQRRVRSELRRKAAQPVEDEEEDEDEETEETEDEEEEAEV